MKIQKLVLTGFGPYAVRQELDFEKNLQDKSMFVITGNTGAGKTSIFDAINFALYGEASGSDREGKSLRSDFADGQTPTEVELWFSLRDKNYYVKRTPSYIKPKQRGEGFVESKATAEIRLSENRTITGAKEVTKEVENILGINTEQFKQLVMIPQGEFKRLLNAKSEEKEDIFRKIFGTEIFERIQKEIKEQANNLKRNIEQHGRDRLNIIRSFSCKEKDEDLFMLIKANEPNIDLLLKKFYEFINGDVEEQEKVQLKMKEESSIIDKTSYEIALGEATNNKFDNFEKKKEELFKLNEKTEEIKNKNLKVKIGKKAITLKGYEDKYNEKVKELSDLNKEIEGIEKTLEIYKERHSKAEANYKTQQNREDEKTQIVRDIEENKRLMLKAEEYEKNKKDYDALEKTISGIKTRIEKIESVKTANNERIELIEKELEEIRNFKDEKNSLEKDEIKYSNKKNKLEKLVTDIKLWNIENQEHIKTNEKFESIDRIYKESKERYEWSEDLFRKNQAGILAIGLEDGNPCPVCGSIHHPKLSKIENNKITEETVKSNKDIFEKNRSLRDDIIKELTNINSTLKSIKENSIMPIIRELLSKDINDISELTKEVNDIVKVNNSLLDELKNKIQVLNSKIDKEKEKIQDRDSIRKANEDLSNELRLKNEEHRIEDGKLSVAKNNLKNIQDEFKGDIKTVAKLKEIEEKLSLNLKAIKDSYEKAENEFNTSKTLLDKEDSKLKIKCQMKNNTEIELSEALKLFKENTLDLGFKDYSDYRNSKLSESEIQSIEKEVNEFNMNIASAKSLYEASLKEVEGLLKLDLNALREKLKNENDKRKALENENMVIFARLSNNKKVMDIFEGYNETLKKDEEKYERVGSLSNIINGENSMKISFERYVLSAYFEDIIIAANLRFRKMTCNRFELLRKQDTGDKRKGQGLDLEVFDNYTGKARDVKTLSGGESFKASLSMALGLADVVQAYAGGIQLDTMFIDEGFGTLDSESLDNAVECLMDLQNDGRLVGIISHVPELKEKIGARLEVTSTNKGSIAKFMA